MLCFVLAVIACFSTAYGKFRLFQQMWLVVQQCMTELPLLGENNGGPQCRGSHVYHARGTGYYPDNSPLEGGFVDMRDHRLYTLQDYLNDKVSYVSVAMDSHAGIRYGTVICIQEMNDHYGRNIVFKVVDTGSAFAYKGHSRIDICVRTQHDSYSSVINGPLTLYFP